MAFILDRAGNPQHIKLEPTLYKAAHDANKSVAQYINSQYTDVKTELGTPFQQLCASEGLIITGKHNPFGLRSPSVADILDGKSGFTAALGPSNVKDAGNPFGSQSRYLFPAALIEYIEAAVPVDRTTDTVVFNDMVARQLSIDGDTFEQPVIDFSNLGGPQSAKAQRIAQLSEAPRMLSITTSDRPRRLPTYGMSIEMSDQAKRAMTLDLFTMTVGRYLEVERDSRVYAFLSSIFAGDSDMVSGAVAAVTSNSLDSAATGGVMTHKAWVKFLARNRKRRKITHCIGDINAYLAVESRTGRPGSNNYDPTLARIDPQAAVVNQGFGNDVKWFIVDDATANGPVPANTVWAIDASQGIVNVTNTQANYTAAEQFVLKRSETLTMQWSSEVYRMFGDADLTPFDVLTIS